MDINLFLQQNQGLVLGVLGFVALMYFLYQHFKDEEPFDMKEPKDITRERLKAEIDSNANKVKKDLIQVQKDGTPITKGKVINIKRDKMPKKVISPVIDPSEQTQVYEANIPIFMAKVIPANTHWLKYVLVDVLAKQNSVAEYYIISEENLSENDDEFVIQKDTQLDYKTGVILDRSQPTENKRSSIIRMESQKELVKGHMNYAPKVNYLYPNHSMDIDKIREKVISEDEL